MELSQFIRIYDEVVEPRFCERIIDLFENHADLHEKSTVGQDAMDSGYRDAIELNLSKQERLRPVLEYMNKVAVLVRANWIKDMKALGVSDFCFPSVDHLILEQWRMHRYDVGQGFYKEHVDTHDANSAARYLALLFYLNDVEEGGETAFTSHLGGELSVPRQGRVLVFPTWWGFPHEALPPISNNKYLLKTYFHYA